ncbi:OsmC family protein [bacterium]|nr:OsmC family protein [bacterium]
MIRSSNAVWKGSLRDGKGEVSLGSGAFKGAYSFKTRFEDSPGTNPEELIAAAHAGCYAMALSAMLGESGFNPDSLEVVARVHLEKGESGFSITKIDIILDARIPGIEEAEFIETAERAKKGCPVSRALAAVPIKLTATLI